MRKTDSEPSNALNVSWKIWIWWSPLVPVCSLIMLSPGIFRIPRALTETGEYSPGSSRPTPKHMFPSGDFHQLLNKWSNSSAVISQPLMSSPLTPPSSSFEVAFSTLQSIPKFWITMHVYSHFKSPTFSSVGDFSPGMKWSDLTNLSCLERGLLVAVSLWALLVFLVSPWFRV